MDKYTHVTLGTTNNEILPCKMSGEHLENNETFKDYEIISEDIDEFEYVGKYTEFYN